MDDIIVFDIETQNFFTDPDVGWNNFEALKISVICAYSYAQGKYLHFEEQELPQAVELFRNAKKIVGFSMNRYDVPVLNAYFARMHLDPPFNLFDKDRLDLLDEIEIKTGKRISLEKLAQANLNTGKTGHGAHAIELYKEGKLEELKAYCQVDVELTKRLYEQYRDEHYFMMPKWGEEGYEKLVFGIGNEIQK